MSNDNKNFSKPQKKVLSKDSEVLIKNPAHVLSENKKLSFSEIKVSSNELSEISKEETLILTDLVNNQETQIKDLNNEKILFERNKIQIDIQKNQQLLIDEYKKKNNKLNLNLNELQTKVKRLNDSNRKFLINDNQLKNTISRYVKHNKNLQTSLNELKKIQSELLESNSQINKMSEQIKFYQDDNSRLSTEIINIQKKYITIKNNFDATDKEKNDIFNQIQELNNSLSKNNVVGTPFVKEKIVEDSINSKVLNDISKNNLNEESAKLIIDNELDKEINDIFK